jgi:hypothetical protein
MLAKQDSANARLTLKCPPHKEMPDMDKEMLANAADLGEIIRLHNEAVERLKFYRTSRPYLMAPNLASMLEGNLKDNIEVLYRELNNLAKPRSEQKQYVCSQCHSVFLQRLPGGICDECRSRQAPGAGRYGGSSLLVQAQPATPATPARTAAVEEPAAATATNSAPEYVSKSSEEAVPNKTAPAPADSE